MWMGEKTHHLLSDYLKALRKGEITDEKIQQLKDEIADEMKKEYELSKNRDFSLGYDRDQKFGLSEHFYGEDIDERLEPSIHKVWANLDAFIASEWNEKVQYYFKTAKMVFIESPRQKDFESMKLKLGNIPELRHINIMASPDFGVVFDDKKYLILDWKSGQEKMDTDGVTDQVKIYALKLILKGNHSVGDLEIEWYEVYLPSLNKIGGKIEKADIDGIILKLVQDIEFQKQFIVDGDVIKNEPLPHTSFPRTTSKKKCANCTFRKVCEDLRNLE